MCSDLSPWWQNQLVLVGHDGVAVLDNYPLNIALWIGQTLQSRSLRGCNSNKASLITKWQYCGEIRNLRNTNPGVLLLSSRALVIAINWDGPPSPPSPSPKVQTWERNLNSRKHGWIAVWVVLLLFLVDKIHHIIVDFLSWLHSAEYRHTAAANFQHQTSIPFKLGNHQG